jgi:type I restriction enzyme S subunit
LNKSVRASFDGLCSADMYPIDAHLDPRYLHQYILSNSFVRAVTAASGSRTVLPKTNQEQLADIRVPVAPLSEQVRIADVVESYLTRLDAAADGLKRVEANLKRYRASVLKAAVEGRLVPTEAALAKQEGRPYEPASVLLARILKERRRRWEDSELAGLKAKGETPKNDKWKERYQQPNAPGDSLPVLPEGWCWVTLDAFLARIETGKSFKCLERPPTDREVGVVKVSAVTGGAYDEHESKTCLNPEFVDEDLFVREGDLLFSRANTIQLVGAAVIARVVTKRLMLSDKILRLRTVTQEHDPWVLAVLRSQIGRRQIEALSTGNQESMRNIGQDRIRQICVPLPPAAEIERILLALADAHSISDASAQMIERAGTRTLRLRQSILKWAFEGKLVDQDPNDEPASVLLARIKAERAAAAAAPVTSRRPSARTKRKRAAVP